MKSLHAWIATLMVAALGIGEVSADILDDLQGSWQGIFSGETADAAPDLPDATLSISRRSGGFEASWTGADGKTRSTRFAKVAGRPFYAESEDGGILSMFGTDPPDPLEGTPLTWARLNEEELVVYRLEIGASGAYELLQNIYTRRDEDFDLDASIWLHGAPASRLKSQLKRMDNER